jgi:organic hydroperoxide reductase OsmC/OhrA
VNLSATVRNTFQRHEVVVATNGDAKAISIAPKPTGYGSAVNGGELLLLALATCFCNDLYREAAQRGLTLTSVEVTATGEFGAPGEAGTNFQYQVYVTADASAEEIDDLIRHTDQVAEIQNTLRQGVEVTLKR